MLTKLLKVFQKQAVLFHAMDIRHNKHGKTNVGSEFIHLFDVKSYDPMQHVLLNNNDWKLLSQYDSNIINVHETIERRHKDIDCDCVWHWLTLVMQKKKSVVVRLVTTKSDGDLIAPAAQYKAPHQDWLVGKDEGFLATGVLHCHLLSL